MGLFCRKGILINLCLIFLSMTAAGAPTRGRYSEEEKTKQTLLEAKELRRLEGRKRTALQEIQRELQLITKYKKRDAQHPDSLQRYDLIAKKYKVFEKRIRSLKNPDELGAVLQRCEFHECADLDDLLSLERTKNELPKKLEELDRKLDQLKKISNSPLAKKDLETLSWLSRKISNIKSLKAGKDQTTMKVRHLWRENRSKIREVRLSLSKMSDPRANQTATALQQFMALINTFESLSGDEQEAAYARRAYHPAPATINVPVLYIHWSDNPPEISDRATLDEGLRQIQETIHQFSYGRAAISFTVCEASGGPYPEGSGPAHYAEAVRLCDPQLDYIGADGEGPPFMLFYPLHGGGGKTHYDREFDSEEGEFRTNTARQWWGEFNVNVMNHEIGHAHPAWKLEHAHSLECDNFVYGGPTCRQGDDYGNLFDSMGYFNTGHFNAKYKESIGWITPTIYSSDQSIYLLRPFESSGRGIRDIVALKLPIPNFRTEGIFEDYRVNEPCDDLYIEYRRPIAGDSDEELLNDFIEAGLVDPEGGLSLHCATTETPETHYRADGSAFTGGGTHSWLLDCSPESRIARLGDFGDSLIRPGERCNVSRLGYIVTFEEVVYSDRARVRVQQPCDASDVPNGSPEECDDIDNNCNGSIDEGCNDDGDWHCDASLPIFGEPSTCPRGGGDCDDNNPYIYPGRSESYCDRHDNNCNGLVDEGGVCPEICDGIDNDENGQTDEGCDQDRDDYCDISMTVVGLPSVCPRGGSDCDDSDPNINPGATEICDGIDNNCLGILGLMRGSIDWVDEGGVCPPPSCTDTDQGYNPREGGSVLFSTGGPTPRSETLQDSCDEGGWILTEYICLTNLSGGSSARPIPTHCPSDQGCINPGSGLPAYCGEE